MQYAYKNRVVETTSLRGAYFAFKADLKARKWMHSFERYYKAKLHSGMRKLRIFYFSHANSDLAIKGHHEPFVVNM